MGADPEVVHLSSSKRTLFVTSCAADVVLLSGPCPPAMRRSDKTGPEPPGLYGTICLRRFDSRYGLEAAYAEVNPVALEVSRLGTAPS